MIAATDNETPLGRHEVSISRQKDEPYHTQWILVVRPATLREWINFHEAEGLHYDVDNVVRRGCFFYEILMD
jgi:hypothetical protein